MSSNIARRDISAGVARRGASGWIVRRTAQEVERVQAQAVVRAAEVEADAYVAHVAMAYAEDLTEQELIAAARYPERAYRFRLIVDRFAASAIRKVDDL